MSVKFVYSPVTQNWSNSKAREIRYIVIHDTGNTSRGSNALAHYKFFREKRGRSAHYFVDDKEIRQIVGDSKVAWAVGDGRGRFGISNTNSLSIEICINEDCDYDKAVYHTLQLVKNLQKRFNVPNERVVRHFDASRKCCPCSMSRNNWAKWRRFKQDLEKPMELLIDTSKDSVAVPVGKQEEGVPTDKEYFEKGMLKIIKVPAERIYLSLLHGKTLRQVGAYGINGTFFDMKNPASPLACWGIAVNGGKPLGENAVKNHHLVSVKRATMIYGEGKVTVERINHIDEIQRKVTWAIGGVGLFPSYDPGLERVPPDILRSAKHTGMAFKGTDIFLIVTADSCTMAEFRRRVANLGVDGAIALDGGGSTQMLWKNNLGEHSTRKLNNMVGVKRV